MSSLISSHLNISTSISISYALFMDCTAINGGGIFTNFDGNHTVRYCEFVKCNATGDLYSRGGAFHIKKGVCSFSEICAYNCYGTHCSDMIFWVPKKVTCSRVQSTKAKGNIHSFYISSDEYTELTEINVSRSEALSPSSYEAFGVSYGSITTLKTKYINVANSNGAGSILSFCQSFGVQASCFFANIINNTNNKAVILFYICTNFKVTMNNSSFIDNSCSKLYTDYNTVNSQASYYDCVFDSIVDESLSPEMISCSFNAITEKYRFFFNLCKFNKLKAQSCKYRTSSIWFIAVVAMILEK
jgi:hypothetical protein